MPVDGAGSLRGLPLPTATLSALYRESDAEHRIAEPGFGKELDPDEAADSHRLLDYSLEVVLSCPPYSAADLELNWVEDQSDCPFSYGVVDGEGRWRIPMGRRYVEVPPSRDGVAEVRLPAEDGSYGGPWTGIDTQGRSADRPSQRPISPRRRRSAPRRPPRRRRGSRRGSRRAPRSETCRSPCVGHGPGIGTTSAAAILAESALVTKASKAVLMPGTLCRGDRRFHFHVRHFRTAAEPPKITTGQ